LTIVSSGSSYTVNAGGSETGDTVLGGGTLEDYGTVISTLVSAPDGHLDVFGSADFTSDVGMGAHDCIYGTGQNTQVSNGGYELVFAGGTAIGTVVSSGGFQNVSAGGTASNTLVGPGGGGTTQIAGSAIKTSVTSGGLQEIDPGGTASGTQISNGGQEWIYSAGKSISAQVSSGGFQDIGSGGTASGLTVSSGGSATVEDGGTLAGTVADDGLINFSVESPRTFSGTLTGSGSVVVYGGGILALSGGDAFTGDITISQATLELASGSAAGSGAIIFGHSGGSSGVGDTLAVDGLSMPKNVLSGMANGDVIDLKKVPFVSGGSYILFESTDLAGKTSKSIELVTSGADYILNLDPTEVYAGGFTITGDGDGGTLITYVSSLVSGYSTSAVAVGKYPPNPYGAVVEIVTGNNGTATGFIIGPHTILTAAHVAWNSSTSAMATDITADIGYSSLNAGTIVSISTAQLDTSYLKGIAGTNPLFLSNEQSDWAVLTTTADLSQYGVLTPYAYSNGEQGTITGYPGADYSNNQLSLITSTTIDSSYGGLVDEGVGGLPGTSGAPLFNFNGVSVDATGIHVAGNASTGVGYSIAFTPSVIAQIDALENKNLAQVTQRPDDFYGNDTSDILFDGGSGDTGFYQMNSGANAGWHDIGPSSTAYAVDGTGDFTGNGTSDVLFRDNATGDTGFYQIVNGALTGWKDIGASSTSYAVVGTGDFMGAGVDDVLFRNNASGDTGFYQIANGVNVGWVDIGASSTAYSVVGIGDFTGNGTDDILYRDNATGDTGFYEIVSGVNTGWHDIGASSTAYSVGGVGDFTGSGTDDILYRDNATGDTGFYEIVNGVNTGWHDIGASSTAYSVVAIGDYSDSGTDDILFRANATGDTGYYQIVSGVNKGWHDIGGSSTAYHVVN
jgi:autotransporter passenger strand-loop-strand repeat protein